jgi:hypothetical protein
MCSFVHEPHLFQELFEQEPHEGVRAVREDAAPGVIVGGGPVYR